MSCLATITRRSLRALARCSGRRAIAEHGYREHEFREHEFHEHQFLDARYHHDRYYPPHGSYSASYRRDPDRWFTEVCSSILPLAFGTAPRLRDDLS